MLQVHPNQSMSAFMAQLTNQSSPDLLLSSCGTVRASGLRLKRPLGPERNPRSKYAVVTSRKAAPVRAEPKFVVEIPNVSIR